MLLHDRAGLVFYGDDAAEGRALGDAAELEWALLEAGLAMERDVLEQRLRDFARARGTPAVTPLRVGGPSPPPATSVACPTAPGQGAPPWLLTAGSRFE